jgi:hypothetical protein
MLLPDNIELASFGRFWGVARRGLFLAVAWTARGRYLAIVWMTGR